MEEQESRGGPAYISTAQVAEALGIGISSVKRWVDRGILPARKTPGGHRKILLSDVLRFARGGNFSRADIARLAHPSTETGLHPLEGLGASVFSALRRGDDDALNSLLQQSRAAGMPIETLADEVIAPAMKGLGHEWAEGSIDVWQEHRGTQLCVAALYKLRAGLGKTAVDKKPLAIGGGPEGDPYLLANLLAEMSLVDLGWEAINLGPNTPLGSFRNALEQMRPRLLWLSVGHLVDTASFLEQYRELHREASRLGTAVAIGGRALTEELRMQMPYTTFGDGLAHLVAVARSLRPLPGRTGRGRPRGT